MPKQPFLFFRFVAFLFFLPLSSTGQNSISNITVPLYEGGSQAEFEELQQLLTDSLYTEAVTMAIDIEKDLKSSQKTIAWEVEFDRMTSQLVQGKDHLIYLKSLNRSDPAKPEWAFALEEVSVNNSRSDLSYAMYSVDLKTGRTEWVRIINGRVDYAIDKQSGILYLFRDKLISIAPETGEILRQYDLEKGVNGLHLGSEVALTKRRGDLDIAPDTELLIHNPVNNLTQLMNVGDFFYVSPDGNFRLIQGDRGLEFVLTPAVKERQNLFRLQIRDDAPLWFYNIPFFIVQPKIQPDAILWINPAYGQLIWDYNYTWGIYRHANHARINGATADIWNPICAWEGGLMTLDEGGFIRFLDIFNNTELASIKLADDYLAMPFQYDDQLIVASYDWIRSYAQIDLLKPDSAFSPNVRMIHAQALYELQSYDSALVVVDQIVDELPHKKDAWKLRTKINQKLSQPEETWLSFHQYLNLDSMVRNDEMYEKWGLMRRFNLQGKPALNTASIGGHMYAGNYGGDLWAVRYWDLYFDKVGSLNRKIQYVHTDNEIDFYPGRKEIYDTRTYPKADFPVKHLDPRWFDQGGVARASQAYTYRGKAFRATIHGGIRELADSSYIDYPPLLGEIGVWKVYFSDDRVLGYGQGVYELDAHMRPNKLLIDIHVNGVKPDDVHIEAIRTNHRSIGVVIQTSGGAYIQVYSYDGELINEVALGQFLSSRAYETQFIKLGNGFLFADRQVHWLSDDKQWQMWKYGPSLAYTKGERYGDRWQFFGPPLLEKGCVYLTSIDGYLYVFDSQKITQKQSTENVELFHME